MVPVLTNKTDFLTVDFSSGFVGLINKESGWSSFDLVKKLRNVVRIKKAGHGGTLDPFATGLMLLGFGKGTKALNEITGFSKRYRAVIRFGVVTDSFDRTGTVLKDASAEHLQIEEIEQAVSALTGELMQVPPMYSAKKVNGVRLYKLARKNIEVQRPPQPVQVYYARILNWENPLLTVDLNVSKGTYIRAWAHDLGQSLETGATLNELKRTAVGDYRIDDSFTVSEFIKTFKEWDARSSRT